MTAEDYLDLVEVSKQHQCDEQHYSDCGKYCIHIPILAGFSSGLANHQSNVVHHDKVAAIFRAFSVETDPSSKLTVIESLAQIENLPAA